MDFLLVLLGVIAVPGVLPLLVSIPLWRKGRKRDAAIWHSVLYFVLLLAGVLMMSSFIGSMDGESAGLLTLVELGSLLWPLGVLILLYLLSLVGSLPIWRKGRPETAALVHWVIYSLLTIIALAVVFFVDFH